MDVFPIIPGTKLDASILYYIDQNNLHRHLRIDDIFKDNVSIVFGGPAPFSRIDSEHAELYERASQSFLDLGINQVVAIYCQDAFVCKKFQEEITIKASSNNVKYYADGDAFFARDYRIAIDFTFQGLCLRSARWCAVVDDCEILWVANDEFQLIENTHPERVLEWIRSQ